MDDDDLLQEILVRLPPHPSSLPRVSLVCKRWRRLLADPQFLRRLSAHHRKPPLLGFFSARRTAFFLPALDPPDWIPAPRFSPRLPEYGNYRLLDCRHGRALLLSLTQRRILVWDPITGYQGRVPFPPAFIKRFMSFNGAVLCAAGDRGHVHGTCGSGPFKVALLAYDRDQRRASMCVYSSATGVWGDVASLPLIDSGIELSDDEVEFQPRSTPVALVGDSLYWLQTEHRCAIVKVDLERQSLAVLELPPDVSVHTVCTFTLVPAEDGGLGLIFISELLEATFWNTRVDCDRAMWVPGRTIELDKLLSLGSAAKEEPLAVVGFAEENSVMLVRTCHHVFMVYLKSLRFKKLCHSGGKDYVYHPFQSFYYAGNGVGDGHGGAEVLHNM